MTVECGLWVRSDVLPDGSYGVTVSVGEDRAWTLPRRRAERYAVACMARAIEAEHDAAVFRLLTIRLRMEAKSAAALVVQDVRASRQADDRATAPMRFVPSLTIEGKPFLVHEVDGETVGQLIPADLRDHAAGVLQVLAAADLDRALLASLTGAIGLDDGTARAVIGALAEHWPEEEEPRRKAGAA